MAPSVFSSSFSFFLLLSSFSFTSAQNNYHNLYKRAVVVPSPLPTSWSYYGCYTDSVGARSLTGATYGSGTAMTDEACIAFCTQRGYKFAGTEYSQECYCGSSLAATSTVAPIGDCNMGCSGNATEACGGPNRLTVFSGTDVGGPQTNPGPPGWTSAGCYTDNVGGRTLATGVGTPGGGAALTVALCTAACAQGNYLHAGVEYGGECYCGNVFSAGGAPTSSGCDMPCNGNSSEFCGGADRLNVYNANGAASSSSSSSATPTSSSTGSAPTGWTNLGCYTDSVGARTLGTPMFVGSPMTVELCTAACHSSGFILAGLEYAGECYCDNTLKNGGGPAPDGSTGCNMPCNGNAAEMCGGSNRLNMYSFGAAPSSSVSASATSSSVSASATTSTLPSGWKYSGCYVDGTNGRILATQQPDNAALTIESCISACVGLGYTVAGMEYSTQCFCDNFMRNGGSLASADTDCGMACGGNSAEKCGGPNRMSVYANGTLQVYQPPRAQNTSLPGNWKYQGCLLDDAVARTFPYQIILTNNNTATNCLTQCSTFGYGAGGMEFGDECYCGDATDVTNAGRTLQPETDCNVACSGNASYICGGGSRISYYTWTGTPLNSWNFATGAAAGRYDFLIGGVIIPLITTPAINGKVTFLEKWGTGPPNSTGAYELDLTEINNFTAAWRPMHVKTDIFCAAGLTLPDKVGRQINIGGWANDATYGVRLYWPDGSPGVPGVNDWQENVAEVTLQIGRWYPTAMIMANGSILVVGGEVGSNGAPIPNLEVLPKPPGGYVLHCDYLQRTDPYNLYPYLAVLPSGGIFIAYYNEARILDESSLGTLRTLPNIPGAVNDFLGGRTYPFEGTAVLMPQHAPYSDPLTIMICGGSTPGPEIALDNCVSISPEVTNANWTIERMPSKRVIPCMAALPDGTYLIMNGGQQGRAGFGLVTEPNHNAVLYDPSKPINQRMTVMANTTIDRLYHSEAVLLQDGRVLVSGSDPEDVRFVQEYRVEVFLPPYLLSGATRPTFSITNTDWSYGQTVSFTTNASGTVRVSLMAAVSSTHGNSMGQRTIFPAVSCSGGSCTVTAPPNAHVVATWVRIGGDPAALGNWPNFPDFNVPGI
ncbi:putative glyoxal oxidase precursor [Trichophaea hybrida]|nr:putative glyoxal oxidase precursor [Trichophaea hybrida]